ncbi:DUF4380 domain-containing protein [Chlamydiales bacterium]|nr:DUF4380 domain-containing protein [Chlamydiales bacterium]
MIVKKEEIRGWNGFRIKTGDLSLGFAPEIGGRIISLTFKGEELLFSQKEHQGETFSFSHKFNIREKKKELGFRLWGGDKTWVSPQNAWWEGVPPLELDAGQYTCQIDGSKVIMTSPICHETGIQITRSITLQEEGIILLDESFYNSTDQEIQKGIWNVTQVMRPFNVFIPIERDLIKPYPEEGDSVNLINQVIHGDSQIECREPIHFKYGALPKRGLLITYREKQEKTLTWIRTFSVNPNGHYAHNASVEVYNSPTYPYLEVEVHAPLTPIPPNRRVSHQQKWYIQELNGPFNPKRWI